MASLAPVSSLESDPGQDLGPLSKERPNQAWLDYAVPTYLSGLKRPFEVKLNLPVLGRDVPHFE